MKTIVNEFFSAKEFREVIGGRFFTAVFTKKNGEERVIRARLGVKKHLKGGTLKYNPDECNNLVVFDLDKMEYRTIRFNALKKITFDKNELVHENYVMESTLLNKELNK